MTSTGSTSTTAPPPTVRGGLADALGAGSILTVLGSLGYISLNGVGSPREAFLHPVGIVSCTIATCGLVMLALALVRWRTTLPGWALLAAAAGLVFAAGNAWFFASGIVAIGEHTDDVLFEQISTSSWVFVMTGPKMALCLVAFLALAVAGWRSGAIPRGACVLLALAAVASLVPPHPPGVILASAALFWISRGRPRSRT